MLSLDRRAITLCHIQLFAAESEELVDNDCLGTPDGRNYVGTVNLTLSGKACQAWGSQTPHIHSYDDINYFPPNSVTVIDDANNYCRNLEAPSFDAKPWCLTMEPTMEREYCDIPYCRGTHTQTQTYTATRHTQTRSRERNSSNAQSSSAWKIHWHRLAVFFVWIIRRNMHIWGRGIYSRSILRGNGKLSGMWRTFEQSYCVYSLDLKCEDWLLLSETCKSTENILCSRVQRAVDVICIYSSTMSQSLRYTPEK